MSEQITLRRLPVDAPALLKRLTVLERWIAAKEIEPWLAVVLAEHYRRSPTDGRDPPSLSPDEFGDLFLDPELLDIMKAQADGPWDVYAAQAAGLAGTAQLAKALAQLGERELVTAREDNVDRDPASAAVPKTVSTHRFDVAVSYAGVDRPFVRGVVQSLQRARMRVFYDDNESSRAWMVGRDLEQEIARIYQSDAAHCVAFLSAGYAASPWTRAELHAALVRTAAQPGYLKPVRLDDTGFPELPKAIVYFDARPACLLADPALLSELLVKALSNRAPLGVPPGPQPHLTVAGSDEESEEVRRYFDIVLPAVLRSYSDDAAAVGATVHFSITGRIREDWLLRLEPPEPSVTRIRLDLDPNIPVLPRHVRIRVTAREMIKMLQGRFDARTALVEGNVELGGDLSLLKVVGALFMRR